MCLRKLGVMPEADLESDGKGGDENSDDER